MYLPNEKADFISAALQSISTGQSLRSFCMANNVPYRTVYDWLTEDDSANSAYARARAVGTHYLADECIDIADDLALNTKLVDPTLMTGAVQTAKVRIDTRLRLIGKWNTADYGEKIKAEHSGALSVVIAPSDAKIG